MKTKYTPIVLATTLALLFAANAWADLDFGQDSLAIPTNHETAAYAWQMRDNPADFKAMLKQDGAAFTIDITPPTGEAVNSAIFFLVDRKFKQFKAILAPTRQGNSFTFTFAPTHNGNFRLESVIKTDKDWVLMSRDIKMNAAKPTTDTPDDQSYKVRVRKIPKKAYTQHVTTLVFEISYNGQPVTDLEEIDGAELHLATWTTSLFKRFGKFTYASSRQNLGGPESAVSLVFRDSGAHRIFTTFKHRGKLQTITTELGVHLETIPGEERIYEQNPAEN